MPAAALLPTVTRSVRHYPKRTSPTSRAPSLLFVIALALAGSLVAADPAAAAASCHGRPVTVEIGSGDSPTSGDDVILGTAGDDVIDGLAGDDVICGQDGSDTIFGSSGNDLVYDGPRQRHPVREGWR